MMSDDDLLLFAGDKPRGKIALADQPYWPLWLTKDEAATYLGVGRTTFEWEVGRGIWPNGTLRGDRGGRLSWHRPTLEELSKAGIVPGRFKPVRA